jgi:hypothetical protein
LPCHVNGVSKKGPQNIASVGVTADHGHVGVGQGDLRGIGKIVAYF